MTDQTAALRHAIRFPGRDGGGLTQDTEWCELEVDGELRRIRFHDYSDIYAIPGLYEQLFYEELECASPKVVCELLAEHLEGRDVEPERLRVLDVGAGNGMVGERLRALGAGTIVGVDILEAAAAATERDRPGVYDDYVVGDLTDPGAEDRELLESTRFNCMTSVAALGFGDIPPAVFQAALDLVQPGGLVAFTIKEDFLETADGSGFSELISRHLGTGVLAELARRRYRHRLGVDGSPLHYVAIVAEKRDGGRFGSDGRRVS